MNKKNILFLEIGSTVFCIVFSFILHFLYEWTNSNVIIALIAPVNESPWEHSKLLFIPYLVYSIFEYFFVNNKDSFIYIKAHSLSIAIPFMIILYFTYSGVLGYNLLFMDILITMLIIGHMNYTTYERLLNNNEEKSIFYIIISFITLIFILLFTFYPPHINLFYCPVKCGYGI